MTERELVFNMRRGLGCAIIELRNHPENEMYRAVVRRLCLKDIAYDIQSEGSKGIYLYGAIQAIDQLAEFEEDIIARFLKRIDDRLFQQLVDILGCYIADGSDKASHSLQLKYEYLKTAVSRESKRLSSIDVRYQFEYMMIVLSQLTGWKGFVQFLRDAAALQDPIPDGFGREYAWFFFVGFEKFGRKRVQAYLEGATKKDPSSQTLSDALKYCRGESAASNRGNQEPVTCDQYIDQARATQDTRFGLASVIGMAGRFAKVANEDDLARIANLMSIEKDIRVRNRLLCVFCHVDFPGDVGVLLEALNRNEDELEFKLPQAISRIKDDRVHDYAITQIECGDADTGYELLKNNWRRSDERTIQRHLARRPKVTHQMQQSIRDIYRTYRSKSCGPILEYIYRRGECGYCRSCIVESMITNRVAPDGILRECLYDSFDETRKIASRVLKRRGVKE